MDDFARKVMEEYLNICGEDCVGDRSVGVPSCPLYEFPDIGIEGGCQIKKALMMGGEKK